MQAAVSGQHFLEKGLTELNSTVFQRFKISQEKCILIGYSFNSECPIKGKRM